MALASFANLALARMLEMYWASFHKLPLEPLTSVDEEA
jgi:hypothetical protein